jgi:hypothetical protein
VERYFSTQETKFIYQCNCTNTTHRWSSSHGPRKFGNAKLHDELAGIYDRLKVSCDFFCRISVLVFIQGQISLLRHEQEYGIATTHYCYGTKVAEHTDMIAKWAREVSTIVNEGNISSNSSCEAEISCGQFFLQKNWWWLSTLLIQVTHSERDLLLCRSVLQYLCVGNLRDANFVFTTAQEKNASLFPSTPLMRFMDFLLKTLERDALPLFKTLRSKYKPSLDRDPSFHSVSLIIDVQCRKYKRMTS